MNKINLSSLFSLFIAGCLAAIALPSNAQLANSPQVQSGFSCDRTGDTPTTIYQSKQGNPEPWIQWVSDHFAGSGWTPDLRCQEVSDRLETYRQNKKLRYVTLGTVNSQSVICVASKNQGPCEGIIYTLKPGQDGIEALNNLFAWRKGDEGLESSYESVTTIPYIDVGSKLDEAPADIPATEPNSPAKTHSPQNHSPENRRKP